MPNLPPLPPHYRAIGNATWNAPAYRTNAIEQDDKAGNRKRLDAIEQDDKAGNRKRLDASETQKIRMLDYGSFRVLEWQGKKVYCGWIWRGGADSASYYVEAENVGAHKRLTKAVEEMLEVDAMRGVSVLKEPLVEVWEKRK